MNREGRYSENHQQAKLEAAQRRQTVKNTPTGQDIVNTEQHTPTVQAGGCTDTEKRSTGQAEGCIVKTDTIKMPTEYERRRHH